MVLASATGAPSPYFELQHGIPWVQETAALRDFGPHYVRLGSGPGFGRCRLNVRFARKRTRLGIYEQTP